MSSIKIASREEKVEGRKVELICLFPKLGTFFLVLLINTHSLSYLHQPFSLPRLSLPAFLGNYIFNYPLEEKYFHASVWRLLVSSK